MPVLIISVYMGIHLSTRLKKRKILLEKTLLFLKTMKTDFSYTSVSVPSLIKKYSEEGLYQELSFLKDCADYMNKDMDFPLSWGKGVSENQYFSREEKNKLTAFGNVIGTSDLKSQLNIIEIYCGYFNELYLNANKKYEKNSEVLILTFTFIGVGLFVLLM